MGCLNISKLGTYLTSKKSLSCFPEKVRVRFMGRVGKVVEGLVSDYKTQSQWDLPSKLLITTLKSPPIRCGIWEVCVSSLVTELKNSFIGEFGSYTLVILKRGKQS